MDPQFAVLIRASPEERDAILAQLADVTTGIIEQDDGLLAYFATHASAAEWGTPIAAPAEDWSTNWQHGWNALPLGGRWFLAPPWDATPTPPNRLRLPMTPGNVFGGGDHPTTQLCLELLETAVAPGERVLDIGTGTGILALAAQSLGALTFACDLDPAAVHLAQQAGLTVWRGSTACLRPCCADLVLANLPGGLLLDIVPELRRLAPRLLLSGYLDTQQDAVEQSARVLARRARGEWRAALLRYPEDRSA